MLFNLNINQSLEYRPSHICLKALKRTRFLLEGVQNSSMVFPLLIATFHALFNAIGLPGNLLVVVTIAVETRFHVMRYILLASLAVSDFLFLILVNSFRIASTAQERWLYGKTMCNLNTFFTRYFFLNTIFHLVAVSCDRYYAIFKSPLTYNGLVTKSRVVFITLIWVIPIPLSIGPLVGVSGMFSYDPKVFCHDFGWSRSLSLLKTMFSIVIFVVPFLVILALNWSVYKAAKTQIHALEVQVGNVAGSESQRQEMSRRGSEKRATIDVSIIIAAFLLCFLPVWIVSLYRRFARNVDVPAEAVLVTICIFSASSVCNPVIYSIRKRDFRAGVKRLLRRIGLYKNSNEIDSNQANTNSVSCGASNSTQDSTSTPPAAATVPTSTQHYER